MAKKWHKGTLVKVKNESLPTKRFWIKVEQEEMPFTFKAGQFITMDLPIGETRLDRWRSYSIANAPDDSNMLELCIVKLEGGRASKYFFEDIELGQEFRFKGPDGVFTLPPKIENQLVFICTGTGIAPFRSMIYDLMNQADVFPAIHLIFGTRTKEGILYREELERLSRVHPNFTYNVALSREKEINPNAFGFDVCQGYVHQVYEKMYSNTDKDITFYLCGWSNMVDQAKMNLIENMGFDPKQVVLELYG